MFSPINLVLDEASFGTKHELTQNAKDQTISSKGELDDRCGQGHYRYHGNALGTASNRTSVTYRIASWFAPARYQHKF